MSTLFKWPGRSPTAERIQRFRWSGEEETDVFKTVNRRRWRWLGFALGGAALVFVYLFTSAHPPVALIPYKVWDAVPGSVTDSEGRKGRIYRAPHGTLAVVVFNKGEGPRSNGPLDRFFTPNPESRTVFMQCTVNLKRLFVGDYQSDQVFRDFLLSRIDGDGWADSGDGVGTVRPEGHPNTYILSDYLMRPMPEGYTVTFKYQ